MALPWLLGGAAVALAGYLASKLSDDDSNDDTEHSNAADIAQEEKEKAREKQRAKELLRAKQEFEQLKQEYQKDIEKSLENYFSINWNTQNTHKSLPLADTSLLKIRKALTYVEHSYAATLTPTKQLQGALKEIKTMQSMMTELQQQRVALEGLLSESIDKASTSTTENDASNVLRRLDELLDELINKGNKL